MLFWAKIRAMAVVAAAVVLMGGAVGTYIALAGPSEQGSVSGAITAIGEGTITLQPSSGPAAVVAVNDATVIKVNGKAGTLADLKVGMRAIALGASGKPATEIRAYTPKPPPAESPTGGAGAGAAGQ